MATNPKRIPSNLEAALAELNAARKALTKLEPMERKVQNARAEVLRAKSRASQAALSDWLKSALWDANGTDLTVETRGGKHWLTTRKGEAALLLKVHESGWLDMAGNLGYTRKHGNEWAAVCCAMTGPNKIGLWYTTADGHTHWMQMHGEDARRVQLQRRSADGALVPVPPMAFDITKDLDAKRS